MLLLQPEWGPAAITITVAATVVVAGAGTGEGAQQKGLCV